jgi:predicted phosphate transport protein (TIGR00153 family)
LVKFLTFPKDTKFYDLFEQGVENLILAAEKLVDLFEHYEDVESKTKQLKILEEQGDTITHQVFQQLHRSFITPIDKEDISLLIHAMDDVMDYIEAAGRTAFLYRIDKPTERALELCSVVLQIARKLHNVIPRLRYREQFKQILQECVDINSLENQADDIHHLALAELFNDGEDPFRIIKWREIYQHLEEATDRGEDVANVLEGIVLKNE